MSDRNEAEECIKALEDENARLRHDLTQYRVALERCHVALINWHALLRNLRTDYENNSLDVLDQIQATKSKSLKALELATPLIEKGRK